MSATSTATDREDALGQAVRDHLRLEIVAAGHLAPAGAVHVSDHAVAAHTGVASNFNRATCLSLEQPDVAFGEIERFFGGLSHTLWLDAGAVGDAVHASILARGYLPLPDVAGMACTALPTEHTADPDNRPELLSEPSDAAAIADVVASGFGTGLDDRLVAEDLARAILRHAKPWHHGAVYGRRHGGTLVAVAALLCTRDVAGIAGVFTVPTHRDRRHATALLRRGLHDAYALGYRTAVTTATPDSEHTLTTLGFRPAAAFRVYRQKAGTGARA